MFHNPARTGEWCISGEFKFSNWREADLCDEHPANTLLTVARELTEVGVRETYRVIEAQDAGLEQFAIHAAPDDPQH